MIRLKSTYSLDLLELPNVFNLKKKQQATCLWFTSFEPPKPFTKLAMVPTPTTGELHGPLTFARCPVASLLHAPAASSKLAKKKLHQTVLSLMCCQENPSPSNNASSTGCREETYSHIVSFAPRWYVLAHFSWSLVACFSSSPVRVPHKVKAEPYAEVNEHDRFNPISGLLVQHLYKKRSGLLRSTAAGCWPWVHWVQHVSTNWTKSQSNMNYINLLNKGGVKFPGCCKMP